MTYFHIFIDLLVSLILLFTITKVLGKSQINQITPFEFVSALVLGELAGDAIYDREIGILQIMFAVTVWAILLFILQQIELKFLKLRGLLEGNPSIVIRDGIIFKNELRKNRMTINQLQNLLREKNVFSVREIEYAILEPNGTVTVIKKSEYDTPSRKELGIKSHKATLPVSLIIDGAILEDNLASCGLDKRWLQKQLVKAGLAHAEDVFFAEWDEAEGIHIVPMPEKG